MKESVSLPVAGQSRKLEHRWQIVRNQLLANRHLLQNQGALVRKVAKGKSYLIVRFSSELDGRRVLRTIHVGPVANWELSQRVQGLLAEFHLAKTTTKELHRMVQAAAVITSVLRNRRKGLVCNP